MTQHQLMEAYKLIKSGQKAQAEAQLRALLESEADNADAWWLLANAASEPAAIREALERDLKLRPDHDVAVKALAALNLKYPPPPAEDEFDDLFSSDYEDAGSSGATHDLPDWFDDEYDGAESGRPAARRQVDRDDSPRSAAQPLKKPARSGSNQNWILWGSLGLVGLFICVGVIVIAQQATSAVSEFASQVAAAQALAAQDGLYVEIPQDVDVNGVMAVGTSKTGNIIPERPDQWEFDGRAGQRILIEVDSDDGVLDPVVFLYDARRDLIAANDDITYGTNLNSRIRTTLPSDGRYTIIIGAFDIGGRYRLELN